MADIKTKLTEELNINPEDIFSKYFQCFLNTVVSIFFTSNVVLGDFLKVTILCYSCCFDIF